MHRAKRELAATGFFDQVYALVRTVPHGRVTSYGAIARALEYPWRAREVGRALASNPHGRDLPAHRVVSAKGELLCRWGFGSPDGQRILLEAEGVQFDEHGRVLMDRFFWEPGEALPPRDRNPSRPL